MKPGKYGKDQKNFVEDSGYGFLAPKHPRCSKVPSDMEIIPE